MRIASLTLLACALACRAGSSGGDDRAALTDSASPTPALRAPVADSTAVIELRTDKAQYRASDRVTLTISNRSPDAFAFNPCARSIERESGGMWVAVEEPGRMCTMEAWMLQPNATRTADTELPAELRPGAHRVFIEFTREGGTTPSGNASARVRATSPTITIVP